MKRKRYHLAGRDMTTGVYKTMIIDQYPEKMDMSKLHNTMMLQIQTNMLASAITKIEEIPDE